MKQEEDNAVVDDIVIDAIKKDAYLCDVLRTGVKYAIVTEGSSGYVAAKEHEMTQKSVPADASDAILASIRGKDRFINVKVGDIAIYCNGQASAITRIDQEYKLFATGDHSWANEMSWYSMEDGSSMGDNLSSVYAVINPEHYGYVRGSKVKQPEQLEKRFGKYACDRCGGKGELDFLGTEKVRCLHCDGKGFLFGDKTNAGDTQQKRDSKSVSSYRPQLNDLISITSPSGEYEELPCVVESVEVDLLIVRVLGTNEEKEICPSQITGIIDPNTYVVNLGATSGMLSIGISEATAMLVPEGYDGMGDVSIIALDMISDQVVKNTVKTILFLQSYNGQHGKD